MPYPLILVVCALAAELPGFDPPAHVELLACGIGPVEAAVATANALAKRRYSAVINAGIAGAFAGCARVGEACVVTSESFADFGWEGGDAPALPEGARLVQRAQASPSLTEQACGLPYRIVRGVTVGQVTTTRATAHRLRTTYEGETESMEGFAVLRAAELAGVPAIEVRGVSNLVGPRAEGQWDFRAGSQAAVSALRALLAVLAP